MTTPEFDSYLRRVFSQPYRNNIKLDLFDALDLKILPSGFYLGQSTDGYVWTNWRELTSTPTFLALNNRLRTFGVPRELRHIVNAYLVDLFAVKAE